jgi:hypothetical protein
MEQFVQLTQGTIQTWEQVKQSSQHYQRQAALSLNVLRGGTPSQLHSSEQIRRTRCKEPGLN